MGWSEFRNWIRQMERQQEGPKSNPDSWRNASSEEHWNEWKNNRERLRGRLN